MPGTSQMKLFQKSFAAAGTCALLSVPHVWGVAIVPGFNSTAMPGGDDLTTGPVAIGFTLDFFGNSYDKLYVNNNGSVTFGASLSAYTPFNLSSAHRVIIAPFFADVDTRGAGSAVTRYGGGMFQGRDAFGVTWDGVGYYGYGTDKLNEFQLLLVDRQDVGPGDFDIYFNYDQIRWETGNASGGRLGLGGFSARAGYSSGDPLESYELPGSAVNGAFLDGGPQSLVVGSNIGETGRYRFQIRNNISSVPDGASTALLLGLTLPVLLQMRNYSRH